MRPAAAKEVEVETVTLEQAVEIDNAMKAEEMKTTLILDRLRGRGHQGSPRREVRGDHGAHQEVRREQAR
jgi:hypothetical protein